MCSWIREVSYLILIAWRLGRIETQFWFDFLAWRIENSLKNSVVFPAGVRTSLSLFFSFPSVWERRYSPSAASIFCLKIISLKEKLTRKEGRQSEREKFVLFYSVILLLGFPLNPLFWKTNYWNGKEKFYFVLPNKGMHSVSFLFKKK